MCVGTKALHCKYRSNPRIVDNLVHVGLRFLEKTLETLKLRPRPLLVGIHPNPGPGFGERLPECDRWRIVFLATENGLSVRQIAKKMHISAATVQNTLCKFRETKTVHDRAGGGRKRKLSSQDEKKIVSKAKRGKSAKQIAREYERETAKPISEHTVRRALKEHHLAYLKITPIPRLTNLQKEKRMKYAQDMSSVDWKSVLFTDEKSFWLETIETHSWQDPGKRKTVKKTRWTKKINVWGGIGYYHKTKLYFFEKNLDGELYQSILDARLPPDCAPDCPTPLKTNWYFIQDNAKMHKTQESMATLEDLVGTRLYELPPYSPDFNIIEDIWSYMDRAVRTAKIKTLRGLKRTLTKIWKELSWDYVRRSVDSIPARLNECIALQGERTHY